MTLAPILAVAIAAVASTCVGCNNPSPRNDVMAAETKLVTKTDVEGLARLVNLPFAPSKVQWATEKFPQGGNWGLSALLALKSADVQTLLRTAEPLPKCKPKVARALLLAWFPPPVQSVVSGLSTDTVPVEATCVRPTPFTTPEKSPAIHGQALIFEKHNLVFLDLYTM